MPDQSDSILPPETPQSQGKQETGLPPNERNDGETTMASEVEQLRAQTDAPEAREAQRASKKAKAPSNGHLPPPNPPRKRGHPYAMRDPNDYPKAESDAIWASIKDTPPRDPPRKPDQPFPKAEVDAIWNSIKNTPPRDPPWG